MLDNHITNIKHTHSTNTTTNIDAVSGSLSKSHPKSVMLTMEFNSPLYKSLFRGNPKYRFNKSRTLHHSAEDPIDWYSYLDSTWYTYDYPEEEIIVLQTMILGHNQILVEIVRKSDMEEVEDDK